MARMLCPFHKEDTPSAVIYPDNFAHCFGCGAHWKVEGTEEVIAEVKPRYVEDVAKSMQRILSLPVQRIRGLGLHTDGTYYYVVWVDGSYYKKRAFDDSQGQKYLGPTGVTKPMFIANRTQSKDLLVICEGEINAMSITQACPELNVVSPGGAGDFYSKRVKSDLHYYCGYKRIVLIADNDKAGAIAAIELKSILLPYVADVKIHLMQSDANEILVTYGREELKEEIEKAVGV